MSGEFFIGEASTRHWYTVAELIELLKQCRPESIVCLSGGFVNAVESEPYANEPFVVLLHKR